MAKHAQLSFATLAMQVTPASGLAAVKVCGVVNPEDASLVATLSREILPPHTDLLIGMILWPGSRRSVSSQVATDIASVATAHGATPVAVFVDETVEEMERICTMCNISTAQLHGKVARENLANFDGLVPPNMAWINVKDVTPAGVVANDTGFDVADTVDPVWTLYDAKGGGTGKAFDWNAFAPPPRPWLLAGGLGPDNVRNAVTSLRPSGLDVASGVAQEDLCRKDATKLREFLLRTVDAYS